jgi:hypothetical protein
VKSQSWSWLSWAIAAILFSEKWQNHEAMMSVFFGVYNFCKRHGTLKTTPGVAAGLTDHIWTIRELLENAGPDTLG